MQFIYSILVQPVFALLLLWRFLSRRDRLRKTFARLGFAWKPKRADIWVHAASVGECNGARAFINILLENNLNVVVTTNSQTGRDTVRAWSLANVTARLAPIDGLGATRRFIRAYRPSAFVTFESEIWPTRFSICSRNDVQIFAVSAKAPKGTASPFARLRRGALEHVSHFWPMDDAQSARLLDIGIDPTRIGAPYSGKFNHHRSHIDMPPPPVLFDTKATRTVLAASTHIGEETQILGAFLASDPVKTGVRLILAPRHPKRADEITKLLHMLDLPFAQRSKGHVPTAETLVYLADTIGEMAHWYGLAKLTVVGGTFVRLGGHTPVEPIMHGSVPAYGQSIFNHAAAFELLEMQGAAIALRDPVALKELFANLPDDSELNNRAAAGHLILTERGDEMTARARDIVATIQSTRPKKIA